MYIILMVKLKADSRNYYIKATEANGVDNASDRIYFVHRNFQDKPSFFNNAIWLLS